MQATIAPVTLKTAPLAQAKLDNWQRLITTIRATSSLRSAKWGAQLVQFTPDDADHDETHHGQCE